MADDGKLTGLIASRVRQLRAAQNLSLEGLAKKSGVSRSMISLIERAECSPTAVVLDKLAVALGVTLASFFERENGSAAEKGPVSRRSEQVEWRDPLSCYTRRNVSPARPRQPVQIVEVEFPAGARVTFETGARQARVCQQIWILHGTMEITIGQTTHRLGKGDCLAMELEAPTVFHNPTKAASRYAVVIASGF